MTVALHTCTRDQAEEITGRFRDAVGRVETAWNVVVTIAIDAFANRVWVPLGYSTWDAYCTAEVDTAAARIPRELRVQIVGQMSAAGMSTRAIAPAVGASHMTVANDLAGVRKFTPELVAGDLAAADPSYAAVAAAVSPKVTGIDGKTYKAAPTPRAAHRKPLTDSAHVAGQGLRDAMEKVERLFDDDRYRQNAEQVALALRGHLSYVAETVTAVLDQLP